MSHPDLSFKLKFPARITGVTGGPANGTRSKKRAPESTTSSAGPKRLKLTFGTPNEVEVPEAAPKPYKLVFTNEIEVKNPNAILIIVGPRGHESYFRYTREALAEHSDYFKGLFRNNTFADSNSGIARIPDFDGETFTRYKYFGEHGTFGLHALTCTSDANWRQVAIHVWRKLLRQVEKAFKLAWFLLDMDFKDACVDAFLKLYKLHRLSTNEDYHQRFLVMMERYGRTGEDSADGKLYNQVKAYQEDLITGRDLPLGQPDMETARYSHALGGYIVAYHEPHPPPVVAPFDVPSCTFHEHGADKPCYRARFADKE